MRAGRLASLGLVLFCACNNSGMVQVPASSNFGTSAFYIDAHEAILQGDRAVTGGGNVPTVSISFSDAQSACTAAGKRLCTAAEWQAACEGSQNNRFGPNTSATEPVDIDGICNVGRSSSASATPAKTGSYPSCVTPGLAIYDMIGNVSEWAIHSEEAVIAGSNASTEVTVSDCEESTTPDDEAGNSTTGFRCCKSD